MRSVASFAGSNVTGLRNGTVYFGRKVLGIIILMVDLVVSLLSPFNMLFIPIISLSLVAAAPFSLPNGFPNPDSGTVQQIFEVSSQKCPADPRPPGGPFRTHPSQPLSPRTQ